MKLFGERKPMELRKDPPFLEILRALVLSGGGANGAWQAGVLSYLAELEEYKRGFEIVTGTSVGSINGAGICHYQPEDFPLAADWVLDLWLRKVKKSSDIYDFHWPKWIAGLLHPSLADTSALQELLDEVIDEEAMRASGIKFRFPSVDLLTGKTVVWNENDSHFVKGIMASASFPIVFPPVEYGGCFLTDGGIRDIAPVRQAIRAARDFGGRPLEMVILHTGFSTPVPEKMKRTDQVALRMLEVMVDGILRDDIADAKRMNKYVRKAPQMKVEGYREIPLKVLGPSENLGDSLDFNAKKRDWQIELGREDAKKAFDS